MPLAFALAPHPTCPFPPRQNSAHPCLTAPSNPADPPVAPLLLPNAAHGMSIVRSESVRITIVVVAVSHRSVSIIVVVVVVVVRISHISSIVIAIVYRSPFV